MIHMKCGLVKPENSSIIFTETNHLVEYVFEKSLNELTIAGIAELRKVKEFNDWCTQAGEHPNNILATISRDIVKQMLDYVKPYYSMSLENGIIAALRREIISLKKYE